MFLLKCGENSFCPNRAVMNSILYIKLCGKTLLSPLIDLFRYLQSNGNIAV